MKKNLFLLGFVLTQFTYAQIQPKSSVLLNEDANTIALNKVSGVSVVTGAGFTYGISENNNQSVWKIENKDLSNSFTLPDDLANLKSANEVVVSNVFGSSLSILTKGLSKTVVDTKSGEVKFSTTKLGWLPINHYMIPESTFMLVEYIKDNKIHVANVDLVQGNLKWSSEIGDKAGFFNRLKRFYSNNAAPLVSPKLVNGGVVGYFSGNLVKLDAETGNVVWKNELQINNFDVNKSGDALIVISKSGGFLSSNEMLNVINANTGKSIWEEPKKVEKVVYLEDLGDKFILASYKGTNLYDYATGQAQWKKNLKGEPRKMIKSEGGYIFVTKNEMNFINQEGKEAWKRDVEISDNKDDEIIELNEKNGNIYYITSTYANIVDKVSGEKKWRKNLKLEEKRPTFFSYDDTKGEYILFNDEKLYRYNATTTERPEEFAKLRLKKEKEVSDLEIREKGFLITGLGEIALVDTAGKLVYQSYYEEPGATGRAFARVGLNTLGVLSQLGAAEVQDEKGNTKGGVFFNDESRQTATEAAQTFFALDANMKTRFNAKSEDGDYTFFFTKQEGNKVLVKVNKDTGKEEKKFVFGSNNKPKYVIDSFSKTIYYINGQKVDVFNY